MNVSMDNPGLYSVTVYAVMSSLSMRAGTPPVFFPVVSPWTLAVPGSQQGLMGYMLEAAWMDG